MKIAICDDEDIFIEEYIKIINQIKKEKNYNIEIFKFKLGEDLLKYITINEESFDLILLDILMGEINGIEVAKEIKKDNTQVQILFLTSSKEYALDGYDVKAFNYVMKNSEGLKDKIAEAISYCYLKLDNYIVVNNKSAIEKIEVGKIVYIESNKRKVIIKGVDFKYEIYEKLDNLYEKVKEFGFLKPHRSYIVNMEYIKRIDTKEIITTTGDIIPISRGNTGIVKEKFMEYLDIQI